MTRHDNLSNFFRNFSQKNLVYAGAASACIVFFLCLCFIPRWETNDDVFMAMIANGFGTMDVGSPMTFYSNIIWGFFTYILPPIGGLMPYSLAQLLAIFVGLWSLSYFFMTLNLGLVISNMAVGLIAFRVILFPQFTLTAGLLSLAAVVGLVVYDKKKKSQFLVHAICLFLWGYLVRKEESILVFGLGMTSFFPVIRSKWAKVDKRAVVLLISIIIGVELVHHFCYRGKNWADYRKLIDSVWEILNTPLAAEIENRKDLLDKYNLSKNDLSLIRNWFLADREILNPSRFVALTKEIKQGINLSRLTNALDSLRGFKQMNPLFYLSVILFICSPSLSLVLVWFFVLSCVFYFGWTVGPDRERVILPLQWLLIFLPLSLTKGGTKNVRYWAIIVSLVFCLVLEGSKQIKTSRYFEKRILKLEDDIKSFPNEPTLIWGAAFPVEDVFHVLSQSFRKYRFSFLILGWGTWMPNSKARVVLEQGEGIRGLLRQEGGVNLVAFDADLQLLEQYCREHLSAKLRILRESKFESLTLRRVQCF